MSSNELDEAFNEVINDLNYISSIAITVFGFIGNSMCIYILSRPELRNISLFRYLIVSVINHCFVLVTIWLCTFQWICESLGCKLSQYFNFLFYDFSGWIFVISLIDRFISVKYPKKFKFKNSLKYQAITIFIVFAILSLIHLPFPIFYEIYTLNETSSCTLPDTDYYYCLNFLSFLVGVCVPFIVMIVITALIGHQLIKRKRKLSNTFNLKKEKKLIKMTLFISVVFFILNFPYYISICIYGFYTGNQLVHSVGISFMIYNLTVNLCYFYSSIQFLLCFLSNKVFRNYFYALFGIKKNKLIPTRTSNFTIIRSTNF